MAFIKLIGTAFRSHLHGNHFASIYGLITECCEERFAPFLRVMAFWLAVLEANAHACHSAREGTCKATGWERSPACSSDFAASAADGKHMHEGPWACSGHGGRRRCLDIQQSPHTHTQKATFCTTWQLTGAAFVAAHPCDFGTGAKSLCHFFPSLNLNPFCAQTRKLMLPTHKNKCLMVRSTCMALGRRCAGSRRPPLFGLGRRRVCTARARPAQVALQSRVRHVVRRQLGRAGPAEDAPRVCHEAPAAKKFGWVLPVL